jgi:hypothetical protein
VFNDVDNAKEYLVESMQQRTYSSLDVLFTGEFK